LKYSIDDKIAYFFADCFAVYGWQFYFIQFDLLLLSATLLHQINSTLNI